MDLKYFKPTSLTWWASAFPLFLGVFVATTPMHGQADLVAVVDTMTGGATPAVLINAGLAGIGLRGAL